MKHPRRRDPPPFPRNPSLAWYAKSRSVTSALEPRSRPPWLAQVFLRRPTLSFVRTPLLARVTICMTRRRVDPYMLERGPGADFTRSII